MMDVRELYQEMIIDHNRSPRNHRCITHATCESRGFNPVCGDKLTVYLKINQRIIEDISFVGEGCAISQASASLMTEALMGKTLLDAAHLFEQFHAMLTAEGEISSHALGKLTVLAGVRTYPTRVKCATLAWHTFEAALKQDKGMVTTE